MKLKIQRLFTLGYLSLISSLSVASSADAWNEYQTGRNPTQEMLEFVVGFAILGISLYLINKVSEHNKAKERKRKKALKHINNSSLGQ